MCDVRLLYSENKSSTPTKDPVCSADSLDCWDGGYQDPAEIMCKEVPKFSAMFDEFGEVRTTSPIYFRCQGAWELPEKDVSVSPSQQPDFPTDSDLEMELDTSYGGQWAMAEAAAPSPSLTSPSPYLDFGISVFDQTYSQVLSNSIKKNSKSPGVKGSKDKVKSDELEVQTMLNVKKSLRKEDDEGKFEEPALLDKRVIHKKTRKELRESIKANTNPDDFRTVDLRVMVANIRGFFSKRESLQAILAREKIDVICLSETLMTGNRFPEIQGYTSYFRNRKSRGGGGIAMLIRDEMAKYAVKTDVGTEENEFMVLKWTNCSPHLVIVVYYGQQSQVHGVDTIKLHLSQLMEVVKKHVRLGCHVNVVGDFNLRIGDEKVKGNHPDSSVTGRIFMDQVDSLGLDLLNSRCQNPITFTDKSKPNHTKLVLDLVLSNQPDSVSEIKTDDSTYSFTPYSVHMRRGVSSRTYADHMSIIYQLSTGWKDRVEFKKDPIWNFKKMLGDTKYDIFTSNACDFLIKKIENEPNIDDVHYAFVKVFRKAKHLSYGKRTVTASKIKRINDDLVWRSRLADLDKLQKMFQDDKEINQVYKTRKSILAGQRDKQNVVIEVEETEEVLEDLEDVLDHILTYNVKNMEKVEPSKQAEEIMRRKAIVIDMMLEDSNIKEFPEVIPWKVYLKVMTKIHRQKKACFRDIIKAGRNFKFALYRLLNRMYAREEFPRVSAVTYLTKIWKKKGSQARLKNNRFIHGKEPISKIWEKCIVEMVASHLDAATPQLQAGSRKGRSTRDQLMKVIVMQKYFECRSRPLPILLVDVQACFDKMVLDDVIYDTIESGADLRATRALRKFSNTTIIKLKGDDRNGGEGEGRTVTNTLGQGSNYAPPGIGLTTSKSLWSEFEGAKNIMAMLGDVVADPQSYVDDIATLLMNEKGLREACSRISRALENISLRSHPDKTEVIISGYLQAGALSAR